MKRAIVIGGEHACWPIGNAGRLTKAGFDTYLLFFNRGKPSSPLPPNVKFLSERIAYSLLDKLLIAGWIALTAFDQASSLIT